jgi:hypothetical protein
MKLEEMNQNNIDRFLNVQNSLWNTLITYNSIMISVISILFVIDSNISKVLILWLFSSCFVSIFLILFNYYSIKKTYYEMQKLDDFYSSHTSEECEQKHKSDVQKAIRKHFCSKVRERIAIIICVLNFILTFMVILFK